VRQSTAAHHQQWFVWCSEVAVQHHRDARSREHQRTTKCAAEPLVQHVGWGRVKAGRGFTCGRLSIPTAAAVALSCGVCAEWRLHA
jgi:hypothetical protein